jgi:predicted secreted protein with PEFG-CTERM motif
VYYKAFFLILIIVTIGLTPSFAFAEESDSISTNLEAYTSGEVVIVFGKIVDITPGLPLTIQIFHNDNLIDVAQISVAQDGTFAQTFNALGPLWSSDGTYTVRGFYTVDRIMESYFQFKNTLVSKTSVFSVNIPNSGVFDLSYSITGGEVKEITLDKDSYSILIDTAMEAYGSLKLQLPRESFDSKKDNGVDDVFIILIKDKDGNIFEAQYQEIETTSDFRMIEIILEPGDQTIEIVGTYVIPEFGSIVSMILLASLASVIIISKNRFASIYNWKF